MYIINRRSKFRKNRYINLEELENINGFYMIKGSKTVKINNITIKNIKIVNFSLAHTLVLKKVLNKFNKLIKLITELLVSDDDSGESFREALNQIERFRLEIKNKYRKYLEEKELKMMSKKLKLLIKEADKKLLELYDYQDMIKSENRHR